MFDIYHVAKEKLTIDVTSHTGLHPIQIITQYRIQQHIYNHNLQEK